MFLLAVSNLADVGIAIAGSASAIATVYLTTRNQNKKLDKVQESVATSNGKTSGQYIEEMFFKLKRVEVGQEMLQGQFAEHAAMDARNFAEIRAELKQLEGDES